METLVMIKKVADFIESVFGYVRNTLEAVANLLDIFRIVPRTLMFLYCWILYDTTLWFMALEAPLPSQSAFIMGVYGAATGLFGLYLGNKRTTKKIVEPETPTQNPEEVAY